MFKIASENPSWSTDQLKALMGIQNQILRHRCNRYPLNGGCLTWSRVKNQRFTLSIYPLSTLRFLTIAHSLLKFSKSIANYQLYKQYYPIRFHNYICISARIISPKHVLKCKLIHRLKLLKPFNLVWKIMKYTT